MDRQQIQRRMEVRDVHGEKLGRVARCGDRTFLIEQGFPFKKRFEARYEDVRAIRGRAIWMDTTGGQLEAEAYKTPLAREPRS